MSSATPIHPEESEILSLLDGELSAAQSRALHRHLESCWHCRKERNEIQAAIDAFVRYRESALLPHFPPPPRSWPDLHSRLEALDLANTPHPRPWPVWRFATAGLAGFALLATAFLFRSPAPTATPLPPRPASRPQQSPAVVKSLPARPALPQTEQPNLLTAEVAVLHALHLAAADLGDPIEVTPTSTEILITALALTPDLEKALTAIPHVRLQITQPQPVSSSPAAGTTVTPRSLLFNVREDFANHVIDLADAITTRAYAWNKLEQRFAAQPLPTREAATIRAIQTAHRTTLRNHARQLRQLLATVFPEPPSQPINPRPLSTTARQFDETVSAAFGGAQSTQTDAALLAQLQSLVIELAQ